MLDLSTPFQKNGKDDLEKEENGLRKGTLSASPYSLRVTLLYSKQYYPHLVHLSTNGLWSHHLRVEPFTVIQVPSPTSRPVCEKVYYPS